MFRVNSFLNPSQLSADELSWAFNVKTRGGIPRTRDGFNSLFRYTCGKAQAISLFTPTNGLPHIVIAISGNIYALKYPFDSYFQLTDLAFNPYVDHIVFKEATVSKTPTTILNNPYTVLMMQDGYGRAAYWDGTIGRHLDPTPDGYITPAAIGASETKIGLWMEWVGDRLWVANGRQLFASDIADPLHFTENQYLNGGNSIQAIDGAEITGLVKTADSKQLLVFTIGNTSAVKAGITARFMWGNTPDFVSMLFPGIGCAAGKSITNVSGELMWMSMEGVRMYSAVGGSVFDAKNPVASHEMKRSWDNKSKILSRCCGGNFDCDAIFGVPSGDILNRHIWALDTSGSDLLGETFPYAWQGVWTGIRPVEFTSGFVNDSNRCFCISQDADSVRVWELYDPSELDGGCDITCFMETKGNTYNSSGHDNATTFKSFLQSQLYLDKLLGTANLTFDYKNEYGCYARRGSWNLCAKHCTPADPSCDQTTQPQNFLPQSRFLVTQKPVAGCSVGGAPFRTNVGTYMVGKAAWIGRLGIRAIKHTGEQFQEQDMGKCETGDLSCITLQCCDPEPEYISCPNDGGNYYGANGCGVISI